jgi:SAM-dependent methyltransferase
MSTTAPLVHNDSDALPVGDAALQVLQIRPPDYVHAEALTELAETVYFGLRRLGIKAFYRDVPDRPARQIVLGAHLLNEHGLNALPPDAIIYNSEQVDRDSPWLQGPYLRALKKRRVWDYNAENAQRLRALGAQSVRYVPVGYVPELQRIPRLPEEADVLFYGSVNERRQKILDALRARGLKLLALFGSYGEARDRAIASAKVVLNMHFYEARIFEIVRAAYLLTNGKAVVAELDPDTKAEADVRDAVYGVSYDRLVDACVELVNDPARREALGERARRVFARRREEDILSSALELGETDAASAPLGPRATAGTPSARALPAILHLGSGKDYREDCFNVDVNPAWGPDAVCDISSPGLIGSTLETARFGNVTLVENSFDVAIANDVLEHISDLSTAMTNALRLLKAGGVFEILVPYDLSHGAWQDPTHVRAFNERSWVYYTDWHWYLGWVEARFDLLSINLRASPFGTELQRAGRSIEELLRTPRAVEHLEVRLRKRYLQESERLEALSRQPGRRVPQPGA